MPDTKTTTKPSTPPPTPPPAKKGIIPIINPKTGGPATIPAKKK